MIKCISTVAVLLLGAVGSAHAISLAPGPDIESGILGITLAGGIAWLINRRRNRT